ncbi:transposase [Gammaproteobacteria bacterium]|nr:transposase [Gammaproteobacteria bacterium]
MTTDYQIRPSDESHAPFSFNPEGFLARLAALVSRPRSNLTRYHGVFAPNPALRRAVVPDSANPSRNKSKKPAIQPSTETAVDRALHCSPLSWAEPLTRGFDIDISVCPLCGGTLKVIADVTEPDAIQTILAHLEQRALPDAGRRQKPSQGPQNDLFAAS